MFSEQLRRLTKQLYPKGRAFRLSKGSRIERFHNALAASENKMLEDAKSTLNSILPDNDGFTVEDAERWEQRLGMISNSLTSLDDRKAAIIRKMNHPGDILARQSWDYLQGQLQLAGFDVYVHENPNDLSIIQVLSLNPDFQQLGQGRMGQYQLGNVLSYFSSLFVSPQLGQGQMGRYQLADKNIYTQKVVNHIESFRDIFFNVGSNNRSRFFIGGANVGEFADVPSSREAEFRQTILRIKPVQTVGYLIINYT